MKVVIVGAGPTGLFIADQLIRNPQIQVELYDRKSSIGNKFLIAGKSGLNITHSQLPEHFTKNYFNEEVRFKKYFEHFNNIDLIDWLNELGVETFVGSSGRVFPKEFKAAMILKKWKERLTSYENFQFFPNSHLEKVSPNSFFINGKEIAFDKGILALGGGSWPTTGSTGNWVELLTNLDIKVQTLKSLNSGFNVNWPKGFLSRDERIPLKYIKASWNDKSIKGDLMLTEWGIEGSPVYYLSHFIQQDDCDGKLNLDLKPDLTREEVLRKLSGKKSTGSKLKTFLDENSIKLLKAITSKEEFLDPNTLIQKIKCFPLDLESARPIEEAISTSGGVCFSELNTDLSFKKYPNLLVGGEMLNWDAPTGGYLLQGCFSQGYIIAKSILNNR